MYDKRISQRKNYLKPIPQKGKVTKIPLRQNFCRKGYKRTQQDVVEHQSKNEHTQVVERQSENEQLAFEYQSDWSELDTGSDYDDDIYWEYYD
ncbi:16953_t:CDS:2 [Dentiscutata erythropus]|uniref:16953_t:CDS:1 n=1 Tax=Dentiscutata erythropus TaxID=1348616 RepID=A0A9N9FTG9_9GLOM|nr:16953_t:CDS:2 [Dentiscutata erythropus]